MTSPANDNPNIPTKPAYENQTPPPHHPHNPYLGKNSNTPPSHSTKTQVQPQPTTLLPLLLAPLPTQPRLQTQTPIPLRLITRLTRCPQITLRLKIHLHKFTQTNTSQTTRQKPQTMSSLTSPSPKSPTGATSRHQMMTPHPKTNVKNPPPPNKPTTLMKNNPAPNVPTHQIPLITHPNKTKLCQRDNPMHQFPRPPTTPCIHPPLTHYSHPHGMPYQPVSFAAKLPTSHTITIMQWHSTSDASSPNNVLRKMPTIHSLSSLPKKPPLQNELQPSLMPKYVKLKNSSVNKSNL